MGMGYAPTWLRQMPPPPASQNHFNLCPYPDPNPNPTVITDPQIGPINRHIVAVQIRPADLLHILSCPNYVYG